MNSDEQNQDPKNDGRRHQGKRGRCGGARRFLGIPIMIAFLLGKSGLVFFLWNELIPDLFHGPMLTYLQAVELMILAKLLVGFGGFGGWRRRFGGHCGGHRGGGPWKDLSQEEREKLRNHLRDRHGL